MIPRLAGDERIVLPALPTTQPAAAFPVLATIAPVAVSIAIWAVTGSTFALVFAALGPAVALASLVDGGRQRRRRTRSERRRFLAEAAECRAEIDSVHRREREAAMATARSAAALLAAVRHDPDRWGAPTAAAVRVTLGLGRIASSARVDEAGAGQGAGGRKPDPDLVRVRRELAARARVLSRAPIIASGERGIGVVGPPALALPVARGYLLQVAALVSPGSWTIETEGTDAAWCAALPHRSPGLMGTSPVSLPVSLPGREGCLTVRFIPSVAAAGEPPVTIAVAPSRDLLPAGVSVVVETGETRGGSGGTVLARHPDRPGGLAATDALEAETVGLGQAAWAACWLAAVALDDAGDAAAVAIPDRVELGAVLVDPAAAAGAGDRVGDRSTLRASFAVGRAGPLEIDLVSGPHAIVGGTTGSGKSELLISWVLALADRYPPGALTVLLVDFKGGASFAALEHLPHCVGVISDLDEVAAVRALASLGAELRHRERVLASCGARSIDELRGRPPELPRLVIVVDEFAAMVTGFPDLHGLFADIAARGRSLGVHLVLGTQRPSGVVRDAVLANAGLRLSLRVNNSADSRAVVGDDSAAALPAGRQGRAVVRAEGGEPVEVQVALAAADDAERVAARWTADGGAVVRRPWLEPLPAIVPFSRVRLSAAPTPVGRLPFALADRPDDQSQPAVTFSPASDGHLLVLGAARSGRSTLTRTLARAAADAGIAVQRAGSADATWDLLEAWTRRLHAGPRSPGAGVLLVLDDLDAVISRFPSEYQAALGDLLASLLREGATIGVTLVITAQRVPAALSAVLASCEARVLLRHASKQDYLLAGGRGDLHDTGLAPGGGTWHTAAGIDRIQVALPDGDDASTGLGPGTPPPAAPVVVDLAAGSLLVVTARPAESAARVRAAAGGARVIELGGSGGPGVDARALTHAVERERVVIIGHPDAWQAHWGSVASLGQSVPVVYEGVGLAEYRAVSRSRRLPPPIIPDPAHPLILLATPDGDVRRARWP